MKYSVYAFAAAILLLTGMSFSSKSSTQTIELPVRKIQKRQTERKLAFLESLRTFSAFIHTKDQKKSNIILNYRNVRNCFKQWEYLAEGTDPGFVKEYINGAPLPKLEKESFAPNIIEPKGMQVLDELMSEHDFDLHEMSSTVNDIIKALESYQDIPLFDGCIFESARMELVRVYTLGLTGFDTPGTPSEQMDAQNALRVVYDDILLYLEPSSSGQFLKLKQKFDQLLFYLSNRKNINYDEILREYIDPLFAGILDLQIDLGIELPNEYRQLDQPVNYLSKSLFASDFLDPWYYTNVPKIYRNDETIELGKLLFYDPVLSLNNQRSCASCHDPLKGFSDQLPKSVDYNKSGTLDRNAQTLLNAIYSDRYFHDFRAQAIDDQTDHVVTNQKEFNTDFGRIVGKLNTSSEYKTLFSKVFFKEINPLSIQNIKFALSAYIASLTDFDSPLDRYLRKEVDEIDPKVLRGFNLFMGKAQCATCHFVPVFNGTVPPLFVESESENLGVFRDPKIKYIDDDPGRGNALLKEKVPFYVGSFKTPTIRNVSLTYPYMHNGAYATLREVLDFYNMGGASGQLVQNEFQTLSEDHLKLNKSEINSLELFLNSLTGKNAHVTKPVRLPSFTNVDYNQRKVGGLY